ncbi:MAG: pilus assembly protein PilP [Syntrophales bacterium]|nr:pilus assembly protein PilP [Syntrophales bacterium]
MKDILMKIRFPGIPAAALAAALAILLTAPLQAVVHDASENEPVIVYRSQGTVDPFVPFVKAQPKSDRAPVRGEPVDTVTESVFRTPLELLTLQEIRLVGIVIGGGAKLALVEDNKGTYYDLYLGTAVGMDGGKVVDILEDHVIIEEREQDESGEVTRKQSKLRLEAGDDRGTL